VAATANLLPRLSY